MTSLRFLSIFLFVIGIVTAKHLMEEINTNEEFSEFRKIVSNSRLLPIILETRGYTAFIPTNEAMRKYKGPMGEDFVHYHLANLAYKIQELEDEVNTDLSGNPVLYVTRIPSGKPSITGWEDNEIFINNAKVVSANNRLETSYGEAQYLHIIDEVLSPTVANVTRDQIRKYLAPDARIVLENSNIFQLRGDFSLNEFYNRANELGAMDAFEAEGKNTFFIPVDKAVSTILKTEKNVIDKQVILGHVVPSEALFTRTLRDYTKQYASKANNGELEVYVSLENVTNPETGELVYYVKSTTVKNDATHLKGTTMAKILKANIPVKNGVVHLIGRPLMVVAENIMSYLQAKEGQLTELHQLIKDHYEDLSNELLTDKGITLFAPSNKAFERVNQERLNLIIANREKLRAILQMHIVKRRLPADEIIENSKNQVFEVESWSPGRKLYFAANDLDSPVPTLTIEGGGVNATITTPNVATKNGVIHIVDRIFGVPSQTVYEKLASDPKLSLTFELSKQNRWNADLNDRNKKFTLFVPSNGAWNIIDKKMKSAYKKLFMGSYPSHVRNILQRHMIVNESLQLDELEKLTTNSTPVRDNIRQTQLQMTRGKIYFQARVRESFGDYYLEWNGVSARVIRPDIECVNGMVHVIDQVLMAKRDVTVSGSEAQARGAAPLLAAVLGLTMAWAML